MCTKNQQYALKLCRLSILDMIKNIIDGMNYSIIEHAIKLLGFIVNEFVSPTKAFTKVDQCEGEIRETLKGNEIILRLVNILINSESPFAVLSNTCWCLGQYTSEIVISYSYRKKIMLSVNRMMNLTVVL